MHQPHSLLLWLLGFHDKQKIPQELLCLKLTLHLVQSFWACKLLYLLRFHFGYQ